ncbi:hypothetical protein A2U01_0089782, partial [Trifolium medium]|nr:hypothetical protein [Trifolium medium]
MPSEDLVREINEIGEQLSKTLKRTFDDISKEATTSLPQKVSKKLKAADVLMIPNGPWFEPKDLKTL